MTDAKVSDTTGKIVKKDLCYQIKVKQLGNNVTLPFDTEMNTQLKNLLALAIENGCKWSTYDADIRKYVAVDSSQHPTL